MLSTKQLQQFFTSENRQVPAIFIGLLLGALAGAVAFGLILVGPFVTFILVAALIIGLAALSNLNFALMLLLGMIAVLPFGTLPFKVGLTLSLIDTALALFLVVYLFQWMTGERRDLQVTPIHNIILLFVLVMLFAFVRGLANGPLTANILRRFVALMANIVMALIIVDVIRNTKVLRRAVLTFMIFGTISAAIGLALWFFNDELATDLLNRLQRIGYPNGDVLRYREDGVSIGNERAIGTWVDPNAFGGFLMMIAALMAPQILSRRPVTGSRLITFGMFGVVMLALFLSDSRGSMLGFLAGVGLVALLRYRNLIWVMALAILVALMLPPTQEYIGRIVAGIQGEDLATQMRFGEYQDAFRLIGRYPVLGVGFSGTPDIDLYLAVASTYLTIAGNAGLVGLSVFLLMMGAIFNYGYQHWSTINLNDDINDLTLGLIAAIIGALVGGIFDHFYFNVEFQATSLTLWLFIGFFLVATRLSHQETEEESFATL